jgi:hypothetical protein
MNAFHVAAKRGHLGMFFFFLFFFHSFLVLQCVFGHMVIKLILNNLILIKLDFV